MLVSQKIALAAHLHVLLRRKTGRVTDPEWMASNVEYGMEIVRFCRAKAKEGVTELAEWADKLESLLMQPDDPQRTPFAQRAAQYLQQREEAAAKSVESDKTRYVGGIR